MILFFETESCNEVKAGLKLPILLPQSPGGWDYGHITTPGINLVEAISQDKLYTSNIYINYEASLYVYRNMITVMVKNVYPSRKE